MGNIYNNISCLNSSGVALRKSHQLKPLLGSLCPIWFPQETHAIEMPRLGLGRSAPTEMTETGRNNESSNVSCQECLTPSILRVKSNLELGDVMRVERVSGAVIHQPDRQSETFLCPICSSQGRMKPAEEGAPGGRATVNPPSYPLEPHGSAGAASDFCL